MSVRRRIPTRDPRLSPKPSSACAAPSRRATLASPQAVVGMCRHTIAPLSRPLARPPHPCLAVRRGAPSRPCGVYAFSLHCTCSASTASLFRRLAARDALPSLSAALHECTTLVGRPCALSSVRFDEPSEHPLPTAALFLKRCRGAVKALGEQLEGRAAYDVHGRPLGADATAKQRHNHWSSWAWCCGATSALRGKRTLGDSSMSAALVQALR